MEREPEQPVLVNVDHPNPSPEPPVHSPTPPHSPIPQGLFAATNPTLRSVPDLQAWSSPAFLKRSRLSSTPFSDSSYDPFRDDEDAVPERRSKRFKFGRLSGGWRFADRTPSPEKQIDVAGNETGHLTPLSATKQEQATNYAESSVVSATNGVLIKKPRLEKNLASPGEDGIAELSSIYKDTLEQGLYIQAGVNNEAEPGNDILRNEQLDLAPPSDLNKGQATGDFPSREEALSAADEPENEDEHVTQISTSRRQPTKSTISPSLVLDTSVVSSSTHDEEDHEQDLLPQSPRLIPLVSPTMPVISPLLDRKGRTSMYLESPIEDRAAIELDDEQREIVEPLPIIIEEAENYPILQDTSDRQIQDVPDVITPISQTSQDVSNLPLVSSIIEAQGIPESGVTIDDQTTLEPDIGLKETADRPMVLTVKEETRQTLEDSGIRQIRDVPKAIATLLHSSQDAAGVPIVPDTIQPISTFGLDGSIFSQGKQITDDATVVDNGEILAEAFHEALEKQAVRSEDFEPTAQQISSSHAGKNTEKLHESGDIASDHKFFVEPIENQHSMSDGGSNQDEDEAATQHDGTIKPFPDGYERQQSHIELSEDTDDGMTEDYEEDISEISDVESIDDGEVEMVENVDGVLSTDEAASLSGDGDDEMSEDEETLVRFLHDNPSIEVINLESDEEIDDVLPVAEPTTIPSLEANLSEAVAPDQQQAIMKEDESAITNDLTFELDSKEDITEGVRNETLLDTLLDKKRGASMEPEKESVQVVLPSSSPPPAPAELYIPETASETDDRTEIPLLYPQLPETDVSDKHSNLVIMETLDDSLLDPRLRNHPITPTESQSTMLLPEPSSSPVRTVQDSYDLPTPRLTQTTSAGIPPIATPPRPQRLSLVEKFKELRNSSAKTSKKSLNNEVSSAISPWFAPKRPAKIVPDSEADSDNEDNSQVHSDAESNQRATSEEVSAQDAQPRSPLQEVSSPISTLPKGPLTKSAPSPPQPPPPSTGFRTSLSYFPVLSNLEQYFNSKVDILAITLSSTSVSRAKSAPRDHHLTLYITDPSSLDSENPFIAASIFRPRKEALPEVKPGDPILLRDFIVQPQRRSLMLLSTESSAWAVFRRGEEVQMKGPPVEFGPEERGYVKGLREWWESIEDVKKEEVEDKVPKVKGKGKERSGSEVQVKHELRDGTTWSDEPVVKREGKHQLRDGTVYKDG